MRTPSLFALAWVLATLSATWALGLLAGGLKRGEIALAALAGIIGAFCVMIYELFAGRSTRKAKAARDTQTAAPDSEAGREARLQLAAVAYEALLPQRQWYRRRRPVLHAVWLAAVTPLLEKNMLKTAVIDVPMVFSMSRLVVLGFAVGMMRQLWRAGLASWPEATLAMVVVLALPLLGALERVAPEQVVDLSKTVIGRFGVGAVRTRASALGVDPSERSQRDDHRAE